MEEVFAHVAVETSNLLISRHCKKKKLCSNMRTSRAARLFYQDIINGVVVAMAVVVS